MPLYEYRCERCNKTVELIRRVSAILKAAFCEDCGHQMKPAISVPATFVRGEGAWSSPPRNS
jgi:putative FmdB family regulatory protein